MLSLAALAAALLAQPQDPRLDELTREAEKLRKQVAQLRVEKDDLLKENAQLRREVENLRALTEENAKEVLLLRQALGAAKPPLPVPPAPEPKPRPVEPEPVRTPPHPPQQTEEILRAKVMAVDAQDGFVFIDKGEPNGVRTGFRFDIRRRVRVPASEPGKPDSWRSDTLGVGEFEKYVGESKAQSRLKIVEGRAQDMKVDDEAVATRKVEAAAEGPKPDRAPAEKQYVIRGKVGDAFMINYGSLQGARQSDRVFVYHDGRLCAQLRIDTVDKDFSIARLIDKTKTGELGEGDEIRLKEEKPPITSRVKWNDDKRGIMIEGGLKTGIKPGMQFSVKRKDEKIGVVMVKKDKVFDYVCEVDPVEPLTRADVQVGDLVESIE